MATFVYLLETKNGNGKLPFVFCKRKAENGSLGSLVGKRSKVINICCISKSAPSMDKIVNITIHMTV